MQQHDLEKYNWKKFYVLAGASLLIALGTQLAANASFRAIIAACLLSLGNFTWGYLTTSEKKKDQ